MQPERRQHLFLHIPKTAGTTLRAILTAQFAHLRIFPDAATMSKFGGYPPNAVVESLEPDRLAEYDLVMGHFRWPALARLFDLPPFRITMLRDPFDRTISELKHILRSPGHFLRAELDEVSVDAILGSERGRNYLRNRQTRTFGKTLAAARDALAQVEFVGIHERFEESIRLLGDRLGWSEVDGRRWLNRAPESQEGVATPDDRQREIIESLIDEDRALYAFAHELFSRRHAAAFGTGTAPTRRAEHLTYFMHIPKAAGTTLRSLLKAHFSDDESVLGYDHPAREWAGGRFADLVDPDRGIRFFAGHLDWSIVDMVHHRELTVVTMLREPVDRTVSAYRHYRRHHGFDGTLGQFIDRHPIEVRNLQTRRLAGDLAGTGGLDDTALLEVAIDRLSDPRLVFGLAERFEESVAKISERLGWDLPARRGLRLNVAPDAPPVTAEDEALIAPHVESDMELYEAAARRFAGRV